MTNNSNTSNRTINPSLEELDYSNLPRILYLVTLHLIIIITTNQILEVCRCDLRDHVVPLILSKFILKIRGFGLDKHQIRFILVL